METASWPGRLSVKPLELRRTGGAIGTWSSVPSWRLRQMWAPEDGGALVPFDFIIRTQVVCEFGLSSFCRFV